MSEEITQKEIDLKKQVETLELLLKKTERKIKYFDVLLELSEHFYEWGLNEAFSRADELINWEDYAQWLI